jgi:hypothetical protein
VGGGYVQRAGERVKCRQQKTRNGWRKKNEEIRQKKGLKKKKKSVKMVLGGIDRLTLSG